MRRLSVINLLAAAVLATGCATPAQRATDREEANLQAVLQFYEAGLNRKDAPAALAYVGDQYAQHNPNAADGRAGFSQFIGFLREKYPNSHSTIVKSFVDGDYVIPHVHAVREPGTRGNAIIDIFRLENGKIVGHWDVTQAVPEKTASGNPGFQPQAAAMCGKMRNDLRDLSPNSPWPAITSTTSSSSLPWRGSAALPAPPPRWA